MTSSYSMEGMDLRLKDGVIELRTQGVRVAGAEKTPAHIFSRIANQIDSSLILYDLRDATYDLSELELEERYRFVARIFKGYRVAYVIHKDQTALAQKACEAHARLGDAASHFTSLGAARRWLKR